MPLCPGLSVCAGTRKVKPIWILLKQETVSGSGIHWAICRSAPRSTQITMPAPHRSVFTVWMPFLPPNQQCQSTEGKYFSLELCRKPWTYKKIWSWQVDCVVNKARRRSCLLMSPMADGHAHDCFLHVHPP